MTSKPSSRPVGKIPLWGVPANWGKCGGHNHPKSSAAVDELATPRPPSIGHPQLRAAATGPTASPGRGWVATSATPCAQGPPLGRDAGSLEDRVLVPPGLDRDSLVEAETTVPSS
jgi:hypothetical protein